MKQPHKYSWESNYDKYACVIFYLLRTCSRSTCPIFTRALILGHHRTGMQISQHMLLLLFSWPLFREVCPNYEVEMFQPRTGTPPDLGSVANFYVAILIITDLPFSALHPMSARGGLPAHAPTLYHFPTVASTHRIIHPPESHLSPYQHTKAHRSLHQNPLPTCLTLHHYNYRIPNAMLLPLTKSLIMLHSDTFYLLFVTTTSPGAPPFPCIPYTYCISQVSPSTPPTTPILPASCQCTPPVYG